MKLFKKSFWVPYDNGSKYPDLQQAKEAILKYCDANRYSCAFVADDKVRIENVTYEIYRGYETGSRGNYGIKCTEI